jgi:hypothetical protein
VFRNASVDLFRLCGREKKRTAIGATALAEATERVRASTVREWLRIGASSEDRMACTECLKLQGLCHSSHITLRRRRHREISGPIDLEIYRRASEAGFARTTKTSVIGKEGLIKRLTSPA